MDMSFEDQIRERAYQIWQAGGMADGQAHEHWVSAEQAMRGDVAAVSAEPEVILTKGTMAAKPRKASTAKAASTGSKAAKPKSTKASAKSAAVPKASRAKKAAEAAHTH